MECLVILELDSFSRMSCLEAEETIYYINDKEKWILKKHLYEILVKGRCLIYTMIEQMF